MRFTNICAYCDKPTNNPKFCSQSCAGKGGVHDKHKLTGVTKCKFCDNDFEWSGYREKSKLFCTRNCAASFNNTKYVKRVGKSREHLNCVGCGTLIPKDKNYTQKYCSRDCGVKHKVSSNKMRILDEFLSGQSKSLKSVHIREHVFNRQNNVCAICGSPPFHNGKVLAFVMDHIDGNSDNNTSDNARLVCPNCDSQLPTFKSRNIGKGRHYRRVRYAEGKSF